MAIQGEQKGKKMSSALVARMPASPGRPLRQLDESLLLELKGRGYGFKRIASEYIDRTGEYVSHMTVGARLNRPSKGGGKNECK